MNKFFADLNAGGNFEACIKEVKYEHFVDNSEKYDLAIKKFISEVDGVATENRAPVATTKADGTVDTFIDQGELHITREVD